MPLPRPSFKPNPLTFEYLWRLWSDAIDALFGVFGFGSVANIAALGAVDDSGFSDGTTRYMQTLRAPWLLCRASTATPDGITVIATHSGVGNWLRQPDNGTWAPVAIWYVNASTGNDENVGGASGTALATTAEWQRRMPKDGRGAILLTHDTVVRITGNLPWTDPVRALNVTPVNEATLTLEAQGTTVLHTGTLNARTLRAPGTGTGIPNDVTDNAGLVWAPYLYKMITFSYGGFGTVLAWVLWDMGGGTARIGVPVTVTGNGPTDVAEVVLAGNETYWVHDLPTLYVDGGIVVNGQNDDPGTNTLGNVVFKGFNITTAGYILSVVAQEGAGIVFRNCLFTANALHATGSVTLLGCGTLYDVVLTSRDARSLYVKALTAMNGSVIVRGSTGVQFLGLCTTEIAGIYGLGFMVQEGDLGAFDSPSEGVFAGLYGVHQHMSGYLYGDGNAIGFHLQDGGRLKTADNTKLVITGTVELSIDGAAVLMPCIEASATAHLPGTSAIVTWANFRAAPFNGKVFNYDSGSYAGP